MNIKLLFIGGVFAEENIDEIIEDSKGTIEFSANNFQERLIKGFEQNDVDISIVSAPFIGAYPMRNKKAYFYGFEKNHNKYKYVPFINLWGIRNFSRASAIKKEITNFVYDRTNKQKLLIVYSAHEPFLEAAVWAKKIDPNIKICFIVPDLPQYMNLDNNRSKIYDLLKKIDILRMNKLMAFVDTFVLLTEQMKKYINVNSRESLILEGIIDEVIENHDFNNENESDIKYIVYTGKLNELFGVKDLVQEFANSKYENYRLVLVGDGDCKAYITEKSKNDSRILYIGQVTPIEAKKWQEKADVLINPRKNNNEYTKYSFPSKTIEYLKTGKPVVAYMLDGMKKEYQDFFYVIDNEEIMSTINRAIMDNEIQINTKYYNFINYANENLSAHKVAANILALNKMGE